MSIQKPDLKSITDLTNDINTLQEFIDQLLENKDCTIKAMYIVTDKNYQIELKGRFSAQASQRILDLIIDSRKLLLARLETVLFKLGEMVQKD